MNNEAVINEFHENNGKVGGYFAGMELLLLHTIGAKSGQKHIVPVAYTKDGDKFVVIASMGGAPIHPAWYHNLIANPEVTIEVGAEAFTVKAHEVKGEERDRLYAAQAEVYPGFKDYEKKTERVIPVFVLEKV
jgi:deazaflavin-dependent oxidoreductase (nitroreductase family)